VLAVSDSGRPGPIFDAAGQSLSQRAWAVNVLTLPAAFDPCPNTRVKQAQIKHQAGRSFPWELFVLVEEMCSKRFQPRCVNTARKLAFGQLSLARARSPCPADPAGTAMQPDADGFAKLDSLLELAPAARADLTTTLGGRLAERVRIEEGPHYRHSLEPRKTAARDFGYEPSRGASGRAERHAPLVSGAPETPQGGGKPGCVDRTLCNWQ